MKHFCTLIFFVLSMFYGIFAAVDIDKLQRDGKVEVVEFTQSRLKPLKRRDKTEKMLDIFCYVGDERRRIQRLWMTVTLKLTTSTDNYALFKADNESSVYGKFEESSQSWLNLMPWKTESVSMAPFRRTCVAVDTVSEYNTQLFIKVVDPWIITCLLVGIILFFSAKPLSRNVLFYYGTGVSVGLIASLLIIIFIVYRFMPKKFAGYVVLFGGSSVTLFALQYVWEHIQSILEFYYGYVIGYLITAAFITFAFLYYKGPVSNPRALSLIQWSIQVLALFLVYNGTQLPEISWTIIAIIIVFYIFPGAITCLAYNYWRWKFPKKIRLLTEDEYHRQGAEETRKALEDLREYCRSPDCNAWKTISRLHTPQRFAKWVEGDDGHLTDDELAAFDLEPDTILRDSDNESELDFMLHSH